jgi:GTPase SAR1 family protein
MTPYNIAIIGETGCGKTSILHRYIFNTFIPHQSTIISEFKVNDEKFDNFRVRLRIWDLSQDQIISPTCELLVHVVDATKPVPQDVSQDYEPPVVLLVNKSDLVTDLSSWSEYALRRNVVFWRSVSAKTGQGIADAFTQIARFLAGAQLEVDQDSCCCPS